MLKGDPRYCKFYTVAAYLFTVLSDLIIFSFTRHYDNPTAFTAMCNV